MAFPILVTNDADWGSDLKGFNAGAMGPFEDGDNRYMILQDPATFNMRAYKRAGAGAFAEMDSGNAPPCADDTGSPAPGVYQYFGVVQNPAAQKLYTVYFNAAFNIELAEFDTATDTWGTIFTSVLTYLFPGLPGSTTAGNMGVAYRSTDDSVWMMFPSGIDGVTPVTLRVSGAKCDLTGGGWDAVLTPLGETNPLDLHTWASAGMVPDSAGNIHCFFAANNTSILDPPGSAIWHQVIHTNNSLSALDKITESLLVGSASRYVSISYPSISTADVLMITWREPSTTGDFSVARGVAGDAPAWSVEAPAAIQGFAAPARFKGTLSLNGFDYILFAYDAGGNIVNFSYINSAGIGFAWSTETLIDTFDTIADPLAFIGLALGGAAFPVANDIGFTMTFTNNGSNTGQGFWALAGAPPPPPATTTIKRPVGGGIYFPRYVNLTWLLSSILRTELSPISSFFLFPNAFDLCLSRDMEMYNSINREIFSCGRRPDCFLINERAWVDEVPGSISFNPIGTIPLPDPADPDLPILSFRVPLGYDGIILAQFHGFTGDYNQGSGDLVWRIRVDGRYLRDCGNMEVSLGSSKQLSPIAGGLQLRSDNFVEYLVAAPNTTGSLPLPGQGNVIAGLHGWFYPR